MKKHKSILAIGITTLSLNFGINANIEFPIEEPTEEEMAKLHEVIAEAAKNFAAQYPELTLSEEGSDSLEEAAAENNSSNENYTENSTSEDVPNISDAETSVSNS